MTHTESGKQSQGGFRTNRDGGDLKNVIDRYGISGYRISRYRISGYNVSLLEGAAGGEFVNAFGTQWSDL
jgi:hypothetical protein